MISDNIILNELVMNRNYQKTWIGWLVVHWLGTSVIVYLNLGLCQKP